MKELWHFRHEDTGARAFICMIQFLVMVIKNWDSDFIKFAVAKEMSPLAFY